MTNHQVVIAGAGPTGLMLAAELAIAGVDVAIVERRETQALEGSRAGGINARTLEVLDQRGVAERFVSEGKQHPVATFLIPLDLRDAPTRFPFTLGLWQSRIEEILAQWVGELGVPIYRGREVTGFEQDDRGVDVRVSDGRVLGAEYLVGCDGGRSVVRRQAGIELTGWDASTSYLIAEVDLAEEAPWGMRSDARGNHGIGKLENGRARMVLEEPHVPDRPEPTLADLRAALVAIYGTDFGAHDATWISRFTDAARQATRYRDRRVLIAGDAAHVHSPVGGQGLNTGVQDAVNLGWKLAQVLRGRAPSLLDTYEAERHPVAARVLRLTLAQTALRRTDDRTKELHGLVSDLMKLDEPRRHYAARIAGLDIHYDLGAGHPLLGRRMPDLDLGDRRVYSLLHDAKPLLLSFGAPLTASVRTVEARYTGPWQLPALGDVPPPSAVLIRPDGHVAWVGDGSDRGLAEAIATWC